MDFRGHFLEGGDPEALAKSLRRGAEAEILIALLNKFVAKTEEGKGSEMGIMSAFSTRKGVVFVEAFRESQVKQAVLGIQNLYGWKPGGRQADGTYSSGGYAVELPATMGFSAALAAVQRELDEV